MDQSRHSRRYTRAGFSLMELMLVVVVIGVLAAIAAPGLSAARADAQVANAASALVRLGAVARGATIYSGLAHTIAYRMGDDGDAVGLFRGTSARCNSVIWNFETPPIEEVSMRGGRYMWGDAQVRMFAPATQGDVRICYQPNGVTLFREGDGGIFNDTLTSGATMLVFDIAPYRGGEPVAAVRQVLFTNGNLPRWIH